ncbi:PEP-CTERM sorting domain-containing protein [Pseudodesulfovibrio cashew]|uniref:PEP-CTERM sorting domain-containing protein n=2 Tax=Pseudodesulfovibrio cashew TaxID=2678688 RepID=A0A6I6JLZ5_9BACT|nr:PEP-CTERM sorting domain-containing protein [Pseudodesulfovibrio cashew]
MYDTLSFATSNNSPTSVTMSLSLEGLLSNTSPDGYATSDTSISIYDITGYSSWLEESAYGLGMVTSFTKVATAAINFAVGDQYWLDLLNQWVSFDDMAYDTTGQTYSFDLTKSLTFEADPLKTYGIRIWTSADANGSNEGISASDFYNTSEVGFTELNGATFESGSGAFLANQGSTAPVATPEPSTILLLGAGLFGLVAVRRKRAAIQ